MREILTLSYAVMHQNFPFQYCLANTDDLGHCPSIHSLPNFSFVNIFRQEIVLYNTNKKMYVHREL